MAQLNSNLHVNRPLSDMLQKFDPALIGYMRDIMWPKKPVGKLSNQIRSIAREQLLRSYNGKTVANGRVTRVDFATGPTDSYQCEVYAFEALLDAIEQENADEELQYQIQKQEAPIAAMNVQLERLAIETALRDTSVFTQNATLSGSLQWNVQGGSSNPYADLVQACRSVASNAQKKANRILMDHLTWSKLIEHPVIQRMVNFWSNGSVITTEILEKMLSTWLEPGSIHINFARYNSAAMGAAETWTSYIHDDVFVGYADQPGMTSWGYGYKFQWNMIAGDAPGIVFEFPTYDAPMGGRVMRTVTAVDYHKNQVKSGFIIKNAVDNTLTEFNGELA